MIDGLETPEAFEFPKGCEQCPEQCSTGGKIRSLRVLKALAEYSAKSLVGDEGVEFDEMLVSASNGDAEQAALLASQVRQMSADGLDDIDDEIDKAQEQSRAFAASCDKPLRMRAERDGKIYTVALCTSALNYYVNSEKPKHSQMHVWVKTD